MASKETVSAGWKQVKPLLSTNLTEARRRVLGLYKAWYRYVPYLVRYYDIPKDEQACVCKIREYFYNNACVTDIRVIDMLVIKGYMELKETEETWQQKGHLMAHWHPTLEPKPCDFLGKFIEGMDQ